MICLCCLYSGIANSLILTFYTPLFIFFFPSRLVTLFLYLNNLPKGQGCTEFPALNLRITPERGMHHPIFFAYVLASNSSLKSFSFLHILYFARTDGE
jgi:hypothetical protein